MDATPTNPGLFSEARDYQTEGARFALSVLSGDNTDNPNHYKAVMLADDPGLGKSLEALMVADGLDAQRILIVSPAVARVAWPILIKKHALPWIDRLWMPAFVETPGPRLDQPNILVILTYDFFSQPRIAKLWMPRLRARRWDLLVLDEAHYLKGESNRTLNIYGTDKAPGLEAEADRVLLLTGTPCPNHAAELFPHYSTFWKELLQHNNKPLGQTDFEERYTKYTDGPWGRQIQGSQGQDTLRRAFAPVILRRRRADVLKDLPPLTVQDVPLSTLGKPLSIPHEVRGMHDLLMAVPAQDLLKVLTESVVSLAALRRLLGAAKAWPAAEWVRERLTIGVDKIIVFAWHIVVIEQLEDLLHDFSPVVIAGDTKESDRAAAVERFQNDPTCRVFIGQTRAAGTAITLTAASEVAVVEPSWTPSDNEQAIARAWRMGQTNPVLASFLYLPGSLDQRIMRAFRRKAEQLIWLFKAPFKTMDSPAANVQE
jgi:SNF2 family DNA or RNA helicase